MAGRPSTLSIQITADASRASRVMRDTEREVERFTAEAGQGFSGLGELAAAAGLAIAGFGAYVVRAASETQQAMGGVDAVFKQNAATVRRFSQEASQAVGLSERAYGQLATIIGSQLKNAGVSVDQLAGKTDSLIRLGADLSAMFGGTATEAVEALSSALKGEFDPLERYGISLSAAAVSAQAAAMGISAVQLEADPNAKLMATLALVTKQSGDATGAFAREADTLAGAQQRLGAELDNVATRIGEKLMPGLTSLTQWANKEGLPALGSLSDAFGDKVGGSVGKAAGALGDQLMPILAEARKEIGDRLVPILKEDFADACNRVAHALQIVADTLKENDNLSKALTVSIEGLAAVFGGQLGIALRATGLALEGVAWVIRGIGEAADWTLQQLRELSQWAKNANPLTELADTLGSLGGAIPGLNLGRASFGAPAAAAPAVHVYLDGDEVRGLVTATVRRELAADGARIITGAWA